MFLCTSCFNDKVIAGYNNNKIYLSEALKAYNDLDFESKSRISSTDECFRFVRRIALEKIILEKAKEEKFDKSKSIQDKVEKAKKIISFEILKKKNVTDKITLGSDDYKKYALRYKLYQIVKRTDILDEKKVDESRKFLNALAEKIKDLDTFKDNAKKYSDDDTAKEGGFVGNIRLGIMEENIDNVIKNLAVNTVSKIVESSAGVHLFFIEGIETVPVNELKKDKALYDLLYKEKTAATEDKWFETLSNDPAIKYNQELLKQKVSDDKVVIQYKSKKVTRKEFLIPSKNTGRDTFPKHLSMIL